MPPLSRHPGLAEWYILSPVRQLNTSGNAVGLGDSTHLEWTLTYQPEDPRFEERVRGSFARQRVMKLFGASLVGVSPGCVEISLPFREDLTQQHGFLHAGVVTAIADSACGYAALTLMPPETAVLTVEYKVNLLSPASGSAFLARGRVTKPGHTLTVCHADVVVGPTGNEKLVATMLATMMSVADRGLAD